MTTQIFFVTFIMVLQLVPWSSGTAQSDHTCVDEIYVLGDQRSSTQLYCSIPAGITATSIHWNLNGVRIPDDQTKYRQASNRLHLSDISSHDEGVYTCFIGGPSPVEIEVACLYVLGKAAFSTCPSSASYGCQEEVPIHVWEGGTIEFDTRITYVGSGPSGGAQTTQALQLFKGSDRGDLLYVCLNWGMYEEQECSPSASVGILQGTHKFDLNLTMQEATVNNSGLYTAKVEVLNPGTGATAYITKAFQVIVDEPDLDVTVAATGSTVAESYYSLTCTVVAGPNLAGNPMEVYWMDPLGNVLYNVTSNQMFLEGPVGDETSVTLTLVFSPLLVRHEGNYTCMGVVNSPDFMSPLTISQTRNVNVREAEVMDVNVKVVNASMLNVSWSVVSYGLSISHLTLYYQTVSLGRIHMQTYFVVDMPGTTSLLVEVAEHIPHLEHQFQVSASIAVDGGQIEGEKSPLTKNSTIELDEVLFQVKVGPIAHCASWMLEYGKGAEVEKDIREQVAEGIRSLCNCTFPSSFIRIGKLSCRTTFTQVTYRSMVIGYGLYSAQDLHDFIEEWVMSSPTICLWKFFILDVDPTCNSHIPKLGAPECSSAQGNYTLEAMIECVGKCSQDCNRNPVFTYS